MQPTCVFTKLLTFLVAAFVVLFAILIPAYDKWRNLFTAPFALVHAVPPCVLRRTF